MDNSIQRLIRIPLHELQTGLEKDITTEDCCCICGKKLQKGGKYKWVHLTTSGDIISSDDDTIIEDSQGFFPVGNECVKRLVINFAF